MDQSTAEQRSDEWFLARLGVFTAGSTFKTIKNGTPKGKRSLLLEKVAEALSQTWHEASAASLEWGKKHEPEALRMYEFMYGYEVSESGLIYHPQSRYLGCSPDGFVGKKGGVEVKCPQTSREHVRNLLEGLPWGEYGPQVQGCLWITGREWWDFISYDPRMPAKAMFYCERIWRDDDYIADLADKAWPLVEELDATIKQFMDDPELDSMEIPYEDF